MRICVAAPVKDEEELLPLFLRHYERFCDSIVVWDNGSTDRTLEIARAHPKVEIREFSSEGFDTASVFRVLEETKRNSVGRFDWVLFPDCDELIVSREPGREREILEKATAHVLVPKGYCLVQREEDPRFDPSGDVLAQRRWGFPCPEYDKPIVTRPLANLKWKAGRHEAILGQNCTEEKSPHLLLLHLDTVDFDLWLKRKMRPISPGDRALKYGVKRWDLPREKYDALWEKYLNQTVNLDRELPKRIEPTEREG